MEVYPHDDHEIGSAFVEVDNYFTLFINVQNFSDRFMGAVTSLLDLAALLSTLTDALPRTSYFKYVDTWFMWYIMNIFLIIVYHVFLDQTRKRSEQTGGTGNLFAEFNSIDTDPSATTVISNLLSSNPTRVTARSGTRHSPPVNAENY